MRTAKFLLRRTIGLLVTAPLAITASALSCGGSGNGPGGGGETGAATVMVEPGDHAAALLSAIEGAQTSVHVTMYLLTSDSFIDALAQQKARGRDVKVVLNANFPEGPNANQRAYDKLAKAGVSVMWVPSNFQYTHEKCVIIDGAQAWIMTMNLTFSAPTANREFLVRDDAPADVGEAEAIFEADFGDRAAQASGPLVVAPVNASDRLLALANGAKTSLDLEGETFSDDAVTHALVAAKNRGVAVHVVLSNARATPAQREAMEALSRAGIPVVQVTAPYIHAKALVADGARAYVGSENFTYNSLHANRELGVVLDAPGEVAKVRATISADFAHGTRL